MFAMGAPFLGFSLLFFIGINRTEVRGRVKMEAVNYNP